MRKRPIIQGGHYHTWEPMYSYHDEDGKEWTHYRCKICGEEKDVQEQKSTEAVS